MTTNRESTVVIRVLHSLTPSTPLRSQVHASPQSPFSNDTTVVTGAVKVVFVVPNMVCGNRLTVFSLVDPPAQRTRVDGCNGASSPVVSQLTPEPPRCYNPHQRVDVINPSVRYRNLLALLLICAWLYGSTLVHLVLQWVGPRYDPNFSHGILVPVFASFVLWQDRKQLSAIAPAPSWTGLPLIVLSMLVLLLGVLGADIFLPRVSFLILLAGLVVLFQGWTFFRAILFPWAFLILMVPIPALIINRVTFPLQLLAARLSTELLELVGVPALREGNIIYLASGTLDIAEACSGIRSLISLITLAVIYAYLMETRTWVRVVLVCLAVPIAVVANSLRILGAGLLMHWGYKEAAEGAAHSFEGLLIFGILAVGLLFAVHHVICLLWKSAEPAPRKVTPPAVRPTPVLGSNAGSVRLAIAAVPLLATGLFLQIRSSGDEKHAGQLPYQIGEWKGIDIPISDEELKILGPGEYLQRNYENSAPLNPNINLYIPFFPSQKAGDTIHSPDHCLTGAGWTPISREIISLPLPCGSSIRVNRYVVSKSGQQQLVLYWFQAHGRVVASEWRAKYYLLSDSIRMNRSDGGMVRLMTLMYDGESPDAAQARIMTFGSQILPMLDNYIPQ
jgi:exosortase D (VPLPA-CTERM-specific)